MDEKVKRFIDLSLDALEEKDTDIFLSKMMKRGELIEKISIETLFEEDLRFLMDIEDKVKKRLEREKRKVIEEIDRLSKKRKGLIIYSPKFPLFPMPYFFDSET